MTTERIVHYGMSTEPACWPGYKMTRPWCASFAESGVTCRRCGNLMPGICCPIDGAPIPVRPVFR